MIRTWSTLQKVNALSWAEAEYLAMIKGVQEAMALQTLLGELGLKVTITVYTDSSAAKASAEKPGLMHMKHMQLRELFLKQVVQQGLVIIEKVNTLWNPADMLTKPVNGQVVQKFWRILSNSWTCEFEVNLVEKDEDDDEPGMLWNFLWFVAATIGVIWMMRAGGRILLVKYSEYREPTAIPRRRSPQRAASAATSRTIACMSKSTRVKGQGLRFAPTKASDEGAFVEGLPVNQDSEMDGVNRNICDKCAMCDEFLGRVRVVCRTCAKTLHEDCVVEHERRHRRS